MNCNEDTAVDKWVAVIEQCDPWEIVWDERLQQYTFLDGTSLAPPDPRLRRHMWKIDSPGAYVRVFIQRVTPEHVDATLRYESRRGPSARPAQVRVVCIDDGRAVVAEWPYPSVWNGAMSGSKRIELAPGQGLRVELVRDEEVVDVSPIYRP